MSTSRRTFLGILAGSCGAAAVGAAGAARAGGTAWDRQPAGVGGDGKQPVGAAGKEAGVEQRVLGATGLKVTVLGFGGAEIGFQQTAQATVSELLNAALDAGLNVIDTAECYAGSEEAIGAAVSHRRKEYSLFTKVGHMDGWSAADGWTAASIEKSIERSLVRLKTDHVDLVQLHSCGVDVLEKGECIAALEAAKKAGKARFIGYSGDSSAALWAVNSGRFDTLQTSVNIFDQECIGLTLPEARKRNMGVIAKRPIGNAVWRYDTTPAEGYHVEYFNRMQKLGYEFCTGAKREDRGPEGAGGIALRFTLMQPGVHVAIVGTTKPQRWRENAELTKAGPLPADLEKAIRETWKAKAGKEWVGQV